MYFFEFMDGGALGLKWWQIVLATLALTHVTIASVTIFLHRSQAHRALDLHPIASHFFRFWLWLTTGMQTIEWVAVHRKHHAKCETAEDPHSPQTRGLKKVFWEGSELYMAEAANRETLSRYGHGTPNDWIERNIYSRFTWQGVGIMLGIDWILFGWVGFTVWAVQMMWIPIFAAGIINGVGHFWGYRNYDVTDASTNIVPWAILIGGEELHNNHHTYPTSARLSSKWYDLLARYARDLRYAYREELEKMRVSAADRQRFAALKRWLRKSDVEAIPPAQQQTLRDMLAHSGVMKTLLDMRTELAAVWGRSATSREQMLAHLQDWIARAEASGIRGLQDAALRIRSYAPARLAA